MTLCDAPVTLCDAFGVTGDVLVTLGDVLVTLGDGVTLVTFGDVSVTFCDALRFLQRAVLMAPSDISTVGVGANIGEPINAIALISAVFTARIIAS